MRTKKGSRDETLGACPRRSYGLDGPFKELAG